jgi:hypothetical protein
MALPRRKHRALATSAAELALAAPQVMAHRLTRMALAGSTPSARDRKEFDRMVAEKAAAAAEAWQAMAMQTWMAQQQLATSWLRLAWSPAGWGRAGAARGATQWQHAALGVLVKGMAPVKRRAKANAKRLARTRLR